MISKKLTYLSVLLLICLLMSVLIINVTATDSELTVVASGTCGTNATWVLDNDGKLIISGTGDISSGDSFRAYKSQIKSVEIEDGISNIGSLTFQNFYIGSVVLPKTLEKIGFKAFYGCTALQEVVIPNTVTKIDSYAFYACQSLTTIIIPNNITTIGSWTFGLCSGLNIVTFKGNAPTIGENAFYNENTKITATIHYPPQDSTWTNAIKQNYGYRGVLTWEKCDIVVYSTILSPTCENSGLECGICTICGCTQTKVISAVGHNFEWVVDTPADKQNTGLKHEECAVCHTKQNEDTVIPKHTCEHTTAQKTDRVAPDHHNIGKEAYWYCAECNKHFSDEACLLEIADISTYGIIAKVDHEFGTTWEKDSNDHWHECTCGDKTDVEAHNFNQKVESTDYLKNNADCITAKTYYYSCECGHKGSTTFTVGSELGHDFENGTWVNTDANDHWKKCSRCDTEDTAHKTAHRYSDYTSNSNNTHSATCVCGKVDTKGCSGGTATCTDKAVCSVCNTVYGIVDVNNHSYASTLTQGDTTHYYECSRCHGKKNEAVHEYANHTSNSNDTHTGTCVCGKTDTKACSGNDASATCQTKATCTVCGSGYGSFGSHDYDLTTWGYKGTDGHAHMCKTSGCTAHDTAVQHTSSGAPTEDDPETCTVCNYVINPATGHIHHTPVSVWSSNATYHWKECVGCADQEFEKGEHVYDNACDTTCNTCEYVRQITHNYTYKHNDTQHWQECSVCGDEKTNSRDNHSGGNATCTDKAVCAYCSVAYGEKNANNHSKSTYHYTTNSNGTHKKIYDCCNVTVNASEACSGGSATCQNKAICQYCNTAYGDVGAHNYDLTTWGYKGADGHAHVCKTSGCNAHDTVVAHTSSGAPTEVNAEICTVCQYVINPALAHTTHIPKSEWSSDATHHWHECTGCSGQQLEKAEHIYDNACDTTCNTCGYVRTVEHNYTELKHNETEHWYECTCGAEKADSRVAHSGSTATCTAKAKCSVCNTEYGTLAHHSYATEWSKNDTEHWHECACGEKSDKAEHAYGDDNVCDTCGFENESKGGTEPPSSDTTPAPVDPGTNSNDDNGGMIAIIIIACVVALGGGGFALWWFVFKKKRI